MSRPKGRLPLPSVCVVCRTTIHAVRSKSKEKQDPGDRIFMVHDAPLAVIVRRGGAHEPVADLSYSPQRARYVPPAPRHLTGLPPLASPTVAA
jgi:hypothetical protein